MPTMKHLITVAGTTAVLALTIGCTREPRVSYSKDVQPILQANCGECHAEGGAGLEKSGLDMSSYDSLMKGTRFGAVIVAGDSVSSTLVLLVEGKEVDPSIAMPHGAAKIPDADIAKIKSWIDQGAKNN